MTLLKSAQSRWPNVDTAPDHCTPTAAEMRRREIAQHMADYKKRGGKVTVIKYGKCAENALDGISWRQQVLPEGIGFCTTNMTYQIKTGKRYTGKFETIPAALAALKRFKEAK